MRWIFDHLGLLFFFAIGFSIWRKAKAFLRQVGEQTDEGARTRPRANFDPEETRRVAQIQEEIRRKIAERRGGDQSARGGPANAGETVPPLIRPARIPPTDPFGGGGGKMGRVLAELERRLQPVPAALPPESVRSQGAQLERQQQLADEMRLLEENRTLTARRAAQATAAHRAEAASGAGLRTVSRKNLLDDLRDPRALRRAFVVREILGAPVGLR